MDALTRLAAEEGIPSGDPSVIEDEELVSLAREAHKANQEAKAAKAKYKRLVRELDERTRDLRLKRGLTTANLDGCQLIQTSRYSINATMDELREVFGDEADELFVEKSTGTLSELAAQDETFLRLIREYTKRLDSTFTDYVGLETDVEMRQVGDEKVYHRRKFGRNPGFMRKVEEAESRGLVKPYSPSVRERK